MRSSVAVTDFGMVTVVDVFFGFAEPFLLDLFDFGMSRDTKGRCIRAFPYPLRNGYFGRLGRPALYMGLRSPIGGLARRSLNYAKYYLSTQRMPYPKLADRTLCPGYSDNIFQLSRYKPPPYDLPREYSQI